MAQPTPEISPRAGTILIVLIALAAVGLFILLNLVNRAPDPMYPRTPRPGNVPIQQQYNTDSLGRQKMAPARQPSVRANVPAVTSAPAEATTLPTTAPSE